MNKSHPSLPKRWLITGGCGFIGRNLVQALTAENRCSLRILDNESVGRHEDLVSSDQVQELGRDAAFGFWPKTGLVLVKGDIRDPELTLKAAEGADIIVHLAASTGVQLALEQPLTDADQNIRGTLHCLEAARLQQVPRFIFASSGAVVGECKPPIHEECLPQPRSPYGVGKLAGEAYCRAYFHSFGIRSAALRFSNVYGPGSTHKTSVVARFIQKAMENKPLSIYGDGQQTRDFIYVDDLVTAIITTARRDDLDAEIFQIATGVETSITELVDLLVPILRTCGYKKAVVEHDAALAGEVRRNVAAIDKARRMLHWQPIVNLPDGLERTVRWFRDRRINKNTP